LTALFITHYPTELMVLCVIYLSM